MTEPEYRTPFIVNPELTLHEKFDEAAYRIWAAEMIGVALSTSTLEVEHATGSAVSAMIILSQDARALILSLGHDVLSDDYTPPSRIVH